MNASSAGGRQSPHSPKRTAKVIPFPRPHRHRRRIVRAATIAIVVGMIGAVTVRIDWFRNTRIKPSSVSSPFAEQEFRLLKLINDERARLALAPLEFSPRLMAAARNHSRDMAARHYLGHDSPAGDTPADRVRDAGLSYEEIGENIYLSDDPDAARLPERALAAWMQSPAHRANLLSASFRLSAAGVVRADNGGYYVTQEFVH
jgi:uncharacterized protein YkwD